MLEILKYPDDRLKQVSLPVTVFNDGIHRLLDEMAVTMYGANGVGLAAPQVGRFVRAFVIDITDATEHQPRKLYEFVNPKISNREGKILFEEGCLSIPGFSAEVSRAKKVRVEFQDRFGKTQVLEPEELLAVAVQHETDHLDGLLFVDRLSPLKRKLAKRKLTKVVTL